MEEKINDEWNRPDDISVNAEEYDKMILDLASYEKAIKWISEAIERNDKDTIEDIKDVLRGLERELI